VVEYSGRYSVPYLRLNLRDLGLEQKRVLAQKLIEITLRAFHLRADQRYRTSIQFITLPRMCGVDDSQPNIPSDADFTLEVIGHDLTEERKRAFAEEAALAFTHLVPVRPWRRIARMFGITVNTPQRVTLQFNELSPAISDPFVVDQSIE